MATVASLHVSEASMRPMRSVDAVTLVPGVGVEGDRYATGRGTYVAFREPGRQLTLISGDGAASAVAAFSKSGFEIWIAIAGEKSVNSKLRRRGALMTYLCVLQPTHKLRNGDTISIN